MAAAMRQAMEDDALKHKKTPEPTVYDPDMDEDSGPSPCTDCDTYPCICDGIEEEEEEQEPEIMKRGKRMRDFEQSQFCEEDYDAFYEEPDLRSYFSQFNLTEQSQIALCRTFANYLAQKSRVKSSKKR